MNKKIVPQKSGRGRIGYGNLLIVRLLIFAVLTRIFTNKGLRTYLEQHQDTARQLGFHKIPHRTTISRWKKKHLLLRKVIDRLGSVIQLLVPTILLIFDSTPLEDKKDPDAKVGYYSRGSFVGFKTHLSVNQSKIPIKAIFTPGNVHDSTQLKELVADCYYGLADAAYDSKANRKIVRNHGGTPVIDKNLRRMKKIKKKRCKWLLKKYRYLIEQVNSIFKNDVIQNIWTKIRGYEKKATIVYSGIAALQVIGIDGLLKGENSLPRISLYW